MQETTFNDYLDSTLADPQRAIGFINASIAEDYPGCVYHALMKVFEAKPEFLPALLSDYVKYLTKSELAQLQLLLSETVQKSLRAQDLTEADILADFEASR